MNARSVRSTSRRGDWLGLEVGKVEDFGLRVSGSAGKATVDVWMWRGIRKCAKAESLRAGEAVREPGA